MKKEVVIASAVRTPIGAYCGMLRDVPVEKLGALVLNDAIRRAIVKPHLLIKFIICLL